MITSMNRSLYLNSSAMTKLGYGMVDNVIRLNARKEGTNKIVQINIEIENLDTGLIKDITIPNKKIVLKEETNECN